MPNEDLDHVLRTPLPWRTADQALTECGRLGDGTALTYDAIVAKIKREGQKRAALTTCMTCWDRCRYRPVLDDRLVDVVAREIDRCRRARDRDQIARLSRELTAIAALIEAHRDEFDTAVSGLAETVTLDAARRERARRRAGA